MPENHRAIVIGGGSFHPPHCVCLSRHPLAALLLLAVVLLAHRPVCAAVVYFSPPAPRLAAVGSITPGNTFLGGALIPDDAIAKLTDSGARSVAGADGRPGGLLTSHGRDAFAAAAPSDALSTTAVVDLSGTRDAPTSNVEFTGHADVDRPQNLYSAVQSALLLQDADAERPSGDSLTDFSLDGLQSILAGGLGGSFSNDDSAGLQSPGLTHGSWLPYRLPLIAAVLLLAVAAAMLARHARSRRPRMIASAVERTRIAQYGVRRVDAAALPMSETALTNRARPNKDGPPALPRRG